MMVGRVLATLLILLVSSAGFAEDVIPGIVAPMKWTCPNADELKITKVSGGYAVSGELHGHAILPGWKDATLPISASYPKTVAVTRTMPELFNRPMLAPNSGPTLPPGLNFWTYWSGGYFQCQYYIYNATPIGSFARKSYSPITVTTTFWPSEKAKENKEYSSIKTQTKNLNRLMVSTTNPAVASRNCSLMCKGRPDPGYSGCVRPYVVCQAMTFIKKPEGQKYNIVNVGTNRCLLAAGPTTTHYSASWLKGRGVQKGTGKWRGPHVVIAPVVMAYEGDCSKVDRAKWVITKGNVGDGNAVQFQNVATKRVLYQLGYYKVATTQAKKSWKQSKIITYSTNPVVAAVSPAVIAPGSKWVNRSMWKLVQMDKSFPWYNLSVSPEGSQKSEAELKAALVKQYGEEKYKQMAQDPVFKGLGQVIVDTNLPVTTAYSRTGAGSRISGLLAGVLKATDHTCSSDEASDSCVKTLCYGDTPCTAVISDWPEIMQAQGKLKWNVLKDHFWKLVSVH